MFEGRVNKYRNNNFPANLKGTFFWEGRGRHFFFLLSIQTFRPAVKLLPSTKQKYFALHSLLQQYRVILVGCSISLEQRTLCVELETKFERKVGDTEHLLRRQQNYSLGTSFKSFRHLTKKKVIFIFILSVSSVSILGNETHHMEYLLLPFLGRIKDK